MTGQTVSHYEILEQLGQGGMGVVYKARDTQLDRIVALKFLPANVSRDEGVKQRFIQEAKAASSLDDPHICTIFEIGQADDGQLFIAMAFYDGSTLQELIERRQIKIDDAASIARQMAKGLSTAHEAGIVHRDVKPANVMVTRKGLVKILDFGVAKLNESTDLTREGSTIGTASYMSPEQARGESLDARSDIWSIGAVLYEMLTGNRPFGGGYEAAVAYSVINEDPAPILDARPDVPQDLVELVSRVLSKDATQRPAEASTLANDLGRFSGDTVVETSQQPALKTSGTEQNIQQIALRFSMAGAVVLGIIYAAMFVVGLPNWVFPTAVLLTLIGLPITLYAASVERKRAALDSAERKQLTGLSANLSTRVALKGGMLAGGVLLVAVLSYSGLRAAGIGPFASLISSGALDQQDIIILTQFENRTEVPELGSTVTEALRIDLSQSTAVSLLDRTSTKEGIQRMGINPDTILTAGLGLQLAEREGVKATIEGEISPLGGAYQISVRIMAAIDRSLLTGYRESASSQEDILAAIDRLSAKLRADIGESLVDIRSNPPLTKATTTSIDALRHLTRSHDLQDEGDDLSALQEAERAIEADSMFGMAYRKAAVLLGNMNVQFQRKDSLMQKAYDLRDRMTEKERLLAEGSIYSAGATHVDQNTDRSIQAYEELLQKWPDNLTALNNLAISYQRKEDYAKAEELFKRALDISDNLFRRTNYIGSLMRQSKFDEFDIEVEEFERRYPGSSDLFNLRRAKAWTFDELEEVELWNTRIDSLVDNDNNPNTFVAPNQGVSFAASRGQLANARTIYENWYRSPDRDQVLDLFNLPDSIRPHIPLFFEKDFALFEAIVTGDTDEFNSVLDQVIEAIPVGSLLDDRGRVSFEFNTYLDDLLLGRRFVEVDSLLNEVQVHLDEGHTWANEFAEMLFQRTRAYVDAMMGGDATTAAIFFEAAIPPATRRWLRDQLGEIYEMAGDRENAIEAYTDFVSGVDYTIGDSDEGRVGKVHFRLGELHEESSDLDQAIYHYQKVIDRWKDGDAYVQPTVTEATRRVEQLLDRKAQEVN